VTRIPLSGGNEHDAFSKRARRMICAFKKAGVAKACKRKYNKRFRKAVKQEIMK